MADMPPARPPAPVMDMKVARRAARPASPTTTTRQQQQLNGTY